MSDTGTERMNITNVHTPYAHSFGFMENGTAYYDPVRGTDLRPEVKSWAEAGIKSLATTAGGAGTAGYGLIPIYVDSRIIDQSRKYTPWVEIIPRVSNQGITADYNIITAKGAAVTANEDAALNDVTDTESRASKSIKYLYSVGRVTGQMIAAMPPYVVAGMQPTGAGLIGTTYGDSAAPNAKQYEVVKRARALKELEDNKFWNGSTSSNSTEFDGIVTQQSTTNKLDKNSGSLEWEDIETVVEYAFTDSGRPNVAGCDSSTYTDLRKILIDAFRLRPGDMGGGEVAAGIASRLTLETMVGPVPVIPDQYLSTTAGSKSIYFLDTTVTEFRVLQDMTYEELAKTNDSQKFYLKMYETLVNKATAFSSFIGEIG